MPVTIVVTIASRMWISLVIIQRVPAHVIAEREVEHKRNERGTPPAPLLVEPAARRPGPIIVVVNPTTVVIRRPAPRLITNPRPTVRRTPRPMTVAIWRPIAVGVDGARTRPPDPAVVVRVSPVAVRVEIFGAQDVFVEILHISLLKLCVILLALFYPIIDGVRHGRGTEFPITGVFAAGDQFGGAPLAQRETRGV